MSLPLTSSIFLTKLILGWIISTLKAQNNWKYRSRVVKIFTVAEVALFAINWGAKTGTFKIPESQPRVLSPFGVLLVPPISPLASSIMPLKKLSAERIGLNMSVPFILSLSPLAACSPSRAINANFALTGPTGIVLKPVIGISKFVEPEIPLKPS